MTMVGGTNALSLASGDPKRIRDEVRRAIEVLGPTNRFILHPMDAIFPGYALGRRGANDRGVERVPIGDEGGNSMSIEKKALIPRVGVASLCSPLEVGADRAPKAADDLAMLLQAAGCEVVELGPIDQPDKSAAGGRKLAESHVHAVVFVATSWFEDYLVFDLLEECPVPVLLWSLPGMETGASVRRATIDRLSETVGQALSGGVWAVGVVRLPESRPCVPPGRGTGISLAAGADRTGRPSRGRHERGGGQRTGPQEGPRTPHCPSRLAAVALRGQGRAGQAGGAAVAGSSRPRRRLQSVGRRTASTR